MNIQKTHFIKKNNAFIQKFFYFTFYHGFFYKETYILRKLKK